MEADSWMGSAGSKTSTHASASNFRSNEPLRIPHPVSGHPASCCKVTTVSLVAGFSLPLFSLSTTLPNNHPGNQKVLPTRTQEEGKIRGLGPSLKHIQNETGNQFSIQGTALPHWSVSSVRSGTFILVHCRMNAQDWA